MQVACLSKREGLGRSQAQGWSGLSIQGTQNKQAHANDGSMQVYSGVDLTAGWFTPGRLASLPMGCIILSKVLDCCGGAGTVSTRDLLDAVLSKKDPM